MNRSPSDLATFMDNVASTLGNPGTICEAAELAGIDATELLNFMTDAGFADLCLDNEYHRALLLAYGKTFFVLGVLAERRKQ